MDSLREPPPGTAEGFHQAQGIANGEVHARIVEGALVDAIEPGPGQRHDLRIEFGHHHLAHEWQAQQFTRRAAVAAADY